MPKQITYAMAVYKYACHLYDTYGQSIGNNYPNEELSKKLEDGSWLLRDEISTLCKVTNTGKVLI